MKTNRPRDLVYYMMNRVRHCADIAINYGYLWGGDGVGLCSLWVRVGVEYTSRGLCMMKRFSSILLFADLSFLNINFFEKFFQEFHQSVKQFGSRSGPMFCRAKSGSKLFVTLISRRH